MRQHYAFQLLNVLSDNSSGVRMKGTVSYVWHDGAELYDEVVWSPDQVSRSEAYGMALSRLSQDHRASRVHVDYGDKTFVEANRPILHRLAS